MTARRGAGPAVGTQVRLRAQRLDDHGQGVGTWEDRQVAVAGALPGDDVMASVTWASPTSPWTRARLVAVVEPSSHRRQSPCAHAPRCPGCPLAPLDYGEQVRAKRERLLRALADAGLGHPEVGAVTPSPSEWGYRQRAKFVVGSDGDHVVLGGYAPGTHDPWPTHACAVSHPAISLAIDAVRVVLSRTGPGSLRHVLARTNGVDVLGSLVVHEAGGTHARQVAAAWMAEAPHVSGVTEHHQPADTDAILSRAPGATRVLCGSPHIVERVAGVEVRVGTDAFTQLNPAAADAMVARAVELAAPVAGMRAVDAYCGLGAFAFALGRADAAEVVAVDDNMDAVSSGRDAARRAGLANVRFHAEAAVETLRRLGAEGWRPDVVVDDPPRKGLRGDALAALVALRPARVVYVSCEPRALAQDGVALQQAGYVLRHLEPLDLFPQTVEVETLALFTAGA